MSERRVGPSRSVSVVIPSKDGRQTLVRALDALVPNAAFISEVVLVFSNSSPAYRAWCESIAARYAEHWPLRLIDSGQQSNGSIARNAGADAARGHYIAFLDDDDEWFPDKLERYFSRLERIDADQPWVLFSTVIACDDDRGHPSRFPAHPYPGGDIVEFILGYGGGAQTSSLLLEADLARRVRFDDRLVRHQDYDFCMRLSEHGVRFHQLAEPLSYWYQRGSSASKGATLDFCQRWLTDNRPRLTSSAALAYAGKEIFAMARADRRWSEFWLFVRANFSRREQCRLLAALVRRAFAAALRKLAARLTRLPASSA